MCLIDVWNHTPTPHSICLVLKIPIKSKVFIQASQNTKDRHK